jgi:hypothetical protein
MSGIPQIIPNFNGYQQFSISDEDMKKALMKGSFQTNSSDNQGLLEA